MFALGQSFFESCRRRRDFIFLLYRAQVGKNDKKRPGGFRFVDGDLSVGGFALSLDFFEAAEVSFAACFWSLASWNRIGASFWLSSSSSFWVAFSDSSMASSFFLSDFCSFSRLDPFFLGLFEFFFPLAWRWGFVFIEDF